MEIPINELKNGGLYRVDARTFIVGIWHEPTKSFIGVRNKFGESYLFQELHYDIGGTARAEKLLEETSLTDFDIDVIFKDCAEYQEIKKVLDKWIPIVRNEMEIERDQFIRSIKFK